MRVGIGLRLGGGLLLRSLLLFFFLAHVMADGATGGGADHTVATGHVTGDTANDRAFQAARACHIGSRGEGHGKGEGREYGFHGWLSVDVQSIVIVHGLDCS